MYSSNQKTYHLSSPNSPVLPALMSAIESRPLQPNPHHARSVTSTASLAAVVAACNPIKTFSGLASSSSSVESPSREALRQGCTTFFLNPKSLGDGEVFMYPTRSGRVGCDEQLINSGVCSDSLNSGTNPSAACPLQDKLSKLKQSRQRICTFIRDPAFTATETPQSHENDWSGPSSKRNLRLNKSDHGRAPMDSTKLSTTSIAKDTRNAGRNAAFGNRQRAVNYNDLMKSEQTGPSSLLPDRTSKLTEPQKSGLVPEPSLSLGHNSGTVPISANGPSSLSSGLAALSTPNPRVLQSTSKEADGLSQVAFLEGPLPPEVRSMIAAACSFSVPITHYSESIAGVNDIPHGFGEGGSFIAQGSLEVEEAERQARRLLSTSRRLKVYREELLTAQAESSDVQDLLQKDTLVQQALETELADIDSKIAALLQERALCQAQFQQQQNIAARDSEKLLKAQERVTVLNEAIENMMRSTQADQLMLRRLVPNLNIENYI